MKKCWLSLILIPFILCACEKTLPPADDADTASPKDNEVVVTDTMEAASDTEPTQTQTDVVEPQFPALEYKVPSELDMTRKEYLMPLAIYGESIPYASSSGIIYAGADGTGYVTFGIGSHLQENEGQFREYLTYEVSSRNGYITSVCEADTITKAEVTGGGKPYLGELNGTHVSKAYGGSGITVRTVTIFEDTITVASYVDGTDAGGTYEGTYSYDPLTGRILAYLDFTYRDNSGNKVIVSGRRIEGKLLEYGGFVHFICEGSWFDTLTPDDPLPLSFIPLPAASDTISLADWAALEFDAYNYTDGNIYYLVRALLRGDAEAFARYCGVAADTYKSLLDMKIGEYRLYREDIPAADDSSRTNAYPVLEFEVLESNGSLFSVGRHRLVFDTGLAITFTPRESFKWYTHMPPSEVSDAEVYLDQVMLEDFSSLSAENMRQFGLCDFIVARLNTLKGNYDPCTADEIRAYAEKYLGVDGKTLEIENSLFSVEGGYIRIGRGGGPLLRTYLSETVTDGITVVTAQFWADYSMTVPSRKVEFHLGMLDGEYVPLKTVVLEDNHLSTVYYST